MDTSLGETRDVSQWVSVLLHVVSKEDITHDVYHALLPREQVRPGRTHLGLVVLCHPCLHQG